MTPVDPYYDGLKSDALGRDFSVLKMKSSVPDEREADDVVDEVTCKDPLPPWLSETFSTLRKGHPLRLLLPKSTRQYTALPASQDSSSSPRDEEEETILTHYQSSHSAPSSPGFPSRESLASPIAIRSVDFVNPPNSVSMIPSNATISEIPFSEPGPASSISSSRLPKLHPTSLYAGTLPRSPQYRINSPTLALPAPLSFEQPGSKLLKPKYTHSRPASAMLARNMPSSAAHVNPQISSDVLPPDSLPLQSCSDLYSTPGPAYYTSRPFDEPQASSDSPQPDETLPDLDTSALQFKWTPFDRRQHLKEDVFARPPTTDCPPIATPRVGSPSLSIDHGDIAKERFFHEQTELLDVDGHLCVDPPHREGRPTSSYSDRLPIISSTDNYDYEDMDPGALLPSPSDSYRMQPGEQFSPQMASTPRVQVGPPVEDSQPPERPETACPFRFRVSPPSRPPRPQHDPNRRRKRHTTGAKEMGLQDDLPITPADPERAMEMEPLAGPGQPQASPSSTSSLPAFAPGPGIYLSPIRDRAKKHGSRSQPREDVGKLKDPQSRLLEAINKVAAGASDERNDRVSGAGDERQKIGSGGAGQLKGHSRMEGSRASRTIPVSEGEEEVSPSLSQGSTESIESWGDK
ncbi:hypothetical protein AAF712_000136 [Marasmius tenuissimus]|uniref:Uncharacterized protein n=1 Tax=Marasmius tenuissimus TaxID=585030 RepID=A0ABR3AF73_9AGAR